MSTTAAVLVRSVVLVVAAPLAGYLFGRVTGGQDANIGAGLFAFAVVIVIAGGWGFLDGRRAGSVGGPMRVWVAVGVVVVLALWVLAVFRRDPADEPLGPEVVIPMGLFFLTLVLAPALVGIALGSAMGGSAMGGSATGDQPPAEDAPA